MVKADSKALDLVAFMRRLLKLEISKSAVLLYGYLYAEIKANNDNEIELHNDRLADIMQCTKPAISKQLSLLAEAKLIYITGYTHKRTVSLEKRLF